MLKKIKKSIDTMFRFVLSLNETKRNETKRNEHTCAFKKICERRAIIGLIALQTLTIGGVCV